MYVMSAVVQCNEVRTDMNHVALGMRLQHTIRTYIDIHAVIFTHGMHFTLSRGGSTASNNNMHDIPSPYPFTVFHHHTSNHGQTLNEHLCPIRRHKRHGQTPSFLLTHVILVGVTCGSIRTYIDVVQHTVRYVRWYESTVPGALFKRGADRAAPRQRADRPLKAPWPKCIT